MARSRPADSKQPKPGESMATDLTGKSGVEKGLIRELAALLEETGLSEIEIEREGVRVRVARQARIEAVPIALGGAPQQRPQAGDVGKTAPPDPAKHPGVVPSPMVGTAYLAAEPGAAPFVSVGARVTQGQTLLIIEAMKTMNHIPAPKAGVVSAILVGNGQPVEFGEPLAIIE
jgi:acetyl-CoA carboxylase biotin carboxyl carrier protein